MRILVPMYVSLPYARLASRPFGNPTILEVYGRVLEEFLKSAPGNHLSRQSPVVFVERFPNPEADKSFERIVFSLKSLGCKVEICPVLQKADGLDSRLPITLATQTILDVVATISSDGQADMIVPLLFLGESRYRPLIDGLRTIDGVEPAIIASRDSLATDLKEGLNQGLNRIFYLEDIFQPEKPKAPLINKLIRIRRPVER